MSPTGLNFNSCYCLIVAFFPVAALRTMWHLACVILCATACKLVMPATLSPLVTDHRDHARHTRQHGCQVSLADQDTCGVWQNDYIALHHDIVKGEIICLPLRSTTGGCAVCFRSTEVAGERAPRYLTVDGYTGLADRIVAAVSGLALAILTDRALVMTNYLDSNKVCTLFLK